MAAQANLGLIIGVFWGITLLSACAAPPAPSPVVVTPPPRPLPALALLNAENQGYVEGLAAGKRIQARHDRARDLALLAKTTPPKLVLPTPATMPAPAAKTAVVVAARPVPAPAPPQISYMPVGPATPVASPTPPGSCGSGFSGCD